MARVSKSTPETDQPVTMSATGADVTPETETDQPVTLKDTPKVTPAASFGKAFPAQNPCDLIIEDARGGYALTLETPEQALKHFNSVISRLQRLRPVGVAHAVLGVHVCEALHVHVPSGEAVVAEAVLVVRGPLQDIEIPMPSLERAQDEAGKCHVFLATNRVYKIEALNGWHAVSSALSVTAREA